MVVPSEPADKADRSDKTYPNPRRDDSVVDTIHGTKVCDPYRWMEDPDSEETRRFVDEQNALSQPYIAACAEREEINKELTKLWNYPKYGVPHRQGQKYFFSKNSGLQNQRKRIDVRCVPNTLYSVMYKQDTLTDEPKLFLDPNSLSEDGTISLATTTFSEDGSVFAYGLSKSGSDWFDVHFKNVETGENYPDVLTKVKFTHLSWTHDHRGLFYGCYPDHKTDANGKDVTSHEHQKLFYHRIGTSQDEDVLCVEFPDEPKWRIDAEVSDCGDYLLVCPQKDCRDNMVFFANLKQQLGESGKVTGKISLTQVVFKFEHDFQYVTNTGSKFVFRTNKGAPNYRLIVIDLDEPEEKNWVTLLPEHGKNVLEWAACVHQNKLIVCYMEDVKNILDCRDLATGNLLFKFPLDIGSIVGLSGKKKHSELFYKFSSMITPGVIYHVDLEESSPTPKVFMETEIAGFNASDFKVEQVFYNSTDDTRIPMFIASRKGEKRDGTSPCLLYGYGGFNISLTPSFSITQLFFIKHFGYMAIPNIRGGGEYGEKWHNAGRWFKKQNCFDDFNCAAEFLIREKYTCTEKLAIKGGSNGGLLVAACVNQRPELFGAAIAAVGVMDMLRFHKFTIGYAWCSDFGNPDEEDHFRNLLKYSPLHNIRVPDGSTQFPSILLTTADHDDRVVPSHSLKYIAQLHHVMRDVDKQTNPLLIRVETKAGHGAGKPTSKAIEENADSFCFLVRALRMEFRRQ